MRRVLALFAVVAPLACGFAPEELDPSRTPDGGPPDARPPDGPPPHDGCTATAEICNGADDDCDGLSDEDFPEVGDGCDGPDLGICEEGTFVCDPNGASVCTDETGDDVEICNGLDDDCDLAIDDGFDFGSVDTCGDCDTQCTNAFGTTSCDAMMCVPACANDAADCDGDPTNGCENLDASPACMDAEDVGPIMGDDGTSTPEIPDTITRTGYGEAWFVVHVTETVFGGGGGLDVRADLEVPAGTDYDLYLYCYDCGAALADFSEMSAGNDDVASVHRDDSDGPVVYDVLVEIRYWDDDEIDICDAWTLTLTGNSLATGNGVCAVP